MPYFWRGDKERGMRNRGMEKEYFMQRAGTKVQTTWSFQVRVKCAEYKLLEMIQM